MGRDDRQHGAEARERHSRARDGLAPGYFPGTAWHVAGEIVDEVQALTSRGRADPSAVRGFSRAFRGHLD